MTNKIPGGTLKAKPVKDTMMRAALSGATVAPGSFSISVSKRGKPPLFRYACPCGCGDVGALELFRKGDPKPSPRTWEWDGDLEAPTLLPSIRVSFGDGKGGSIEHWHGFIEKGVWRDA